MIPQDFSRAAQIWAGVCWGAAAVLWLAACVWFVGNALWGTS